MPSFSQPELLSHLQQQTTDIQTTVESEWQTMPDDVLLFKENESKWSAIQCLAHLNSYGDYYLPAISKSIDAAVQKKQWATERFTTSLLGNWFTNLMLPKGSDQPIRKMKSPKAHLPLSNGNSEFVMKKFIAQQAQLLLLLEKARVVDLRKAKTPVSISRIFRLPLGDTFRFLIAHHQRHLLQAKRSLSLCQQLAMTS